jgi:ABC-type uncharacterized transport system substrate-binding protein
VRVEWIFDKAYSKFATDGLDTNGDGIYSDGELEPLTRTNLAALKTYGYFIFMRLDGVVQKIGDAADAGQSFAQNQLSLRFTIPLLNPIDPRTGQFMLKVYDPEFFIDFEYAKKIPVSVAGAIPASCKLLLKPVLTDAELEQTRLMLSNKGTEWKPENNEDFGGMFAQPVMVECGA